MIPQRVVKPELSSTSGVTANDSLLVPQVTASQATTQILLCVREAVERQVLTEGVCNRLRAAIDAICDKQALSEDAVIVLDALQELREAHRESALSFGVMRYGVERFIRPCLCTEDSSTVGENSVSWGLDRLLEALATESGVVERGAIKEVVLRELVRGACSLTNEDRAILYRNLAISDLAFVRSSQVSSEAAPVCSQYLKFCESLYSVVAPIEIRWREHNEPSLRCSRSFVTTWLSIMQESPETSLPAVTCLDNQHARQFVDNLFRHFCTSVMSCPHRYDQSEQQLRSLVRMFVSGTGDGVEESGNFLGRVDDCYTRLLREMFYAELAQAEDSLRFLGASRGLTRMVKALGKPEVISRLPFGEYRQEVHVSVSPIPQSDGTLGVSFELTKGSNVLALRLWSAGEQDRKGLLRAAIKVNLNGEELDYGVVHGGSLRQILLQPRVSDPGLGTDSCESESAGEVGEVEGFQLNSVAVSPKQFYSLLDMLSTAAHAAAYIEVSRRPAGSADR